MVFSKLRFYFIINAIFIGAILFYQMIWLFSETTDGRILGFHKMATSGEYKHIEEIEVKYMVDYQIYIQYYTRNGIPETQKFLPVRYLPFAPSISRPDTFEGNWLILIVTYALFFATSTIFLTLNNDLMPKQTLVYLKKSRPWIGIIRNPAI